MDELKAFLELAVMLVTDPRTVVLFSLLVYAAVIDVRSHRIPNRLVLSGLAFGLIYSVFVPFWGHLGFLWALGGAAIGFGVLFPFWLLRMMGAGDVKLMAVVGSLLGAQMIQTALLASLATSGVFAIAFALHHGKLRQMFANVGRVLRVGSIAVAMGAPVSVAHSGWQSVGKLAFAVPIAVGTIGTVVASHFGFL
ncbi:prepilin peptidase [Massilia sp. LXY-6]|uniref:A24 family peptidase n=1 Tax=Massilia sp. LXY-6 TaxID=3379823 RepID=UPI003EE154F0